MKWYILVATLIWCSCSQTKPSIQHTAVDKSKNSTRPQKIVQEKTQVRENQKVIKAHTVQKLHKPKKKPIFDTKKITIIIDAGHGGQNKGTKSITLPRVYEKDLTLQTAVKVQKQLVNLGYRVLMTRKKDIDLSLEKRVSFLRKNKGTFFVSIHFNSAPNKQANGIEIYYYLENSHSKCTKLSKKMAHDVLYNILKQTHLGNRGVRAGNFFVIRHSYAPSILIEGGFLSNPQEADRIKTSKYIQSLALGIADGLDSFAKREYEELVRK